MRVERLPGVSASQSKCNLSRPLLVPLFSCFPSQTVCMYRSYFCSCLPPLPGRKLLYGGILTHVGSLLEPEMVPIGPAGDEQLLMK